MGAKTIITVPLHYTERQIMQETCTQRKTYANALVTQK